MSSSQWLIPLGYLAGSIPFGLLIARVSRGVDVRSVGSGNIGATNVLRAAGSGAAALTLILDAMKGWAPVAAAQALGGSERLVAAVGLAAFLGHLYPIFLGFHGGKGVATFLGVLLALNPRVASLIVAIWLLIAVIVRYSSVAALIASASSPAVVWLFDGRRSYVALTVILFVFVLIRHRENLRRLVAGEERRIGQKPRVNDASLSPRDRSAA